MTSHGFDIVICRTPLAALAPCFSPTAGAVLDFWGVVRGAEGSSDIAGIDYESHEAMARHQLELIAREAVERFALEGLTVHHRVGFVPTAEPSLFLRVAAGHRGPAFDAGRWFIEELKRRVPIWKHPLAGADGKEIPSAPPPGDAVTPALASAGKAEDGGGAQVELLAKPGERLPPHTAPPIPR